MNMFWDERYSDSEYVYGVQPNEFFKAQLAKLKSGRLLQLGEGEGRNAVYAAKQGWLVDAVDSSKQAKTKALSLAEENNVSINYNVEPLEDFVPQKAEYDAVGIIFVHLEFDLSKKVHARAIEALKPGGKIILQVFEKEQLGRTSGGPKTLDQLYTLDDIRNNFESLTTEILHKEVIMLSEGKFHSGEGVVISFVGVKQA
jgi:2-polyprenyl-3-methyl-5-hydroxy-6-metoxy-1,4-benzoquinol methylase